MTQPRAVSCSTCGHGYEGCPTCQSLRAENERLIAMVHEGVDIICERDSLQLQLAQAQSEAAAMRTLLEEAVDELCYHLDAAEQWKKIGGRVWCSDCQSYLRTEADVTLRDRIQQALSPSAGSDLVERMRLLEAVADAAREQIRVMDPEYVECMNDLRAIRDALAALDSERSKGRASRANAHRERSEQTSDSEVSREGK